MPIEEQDFSDDEEEARAKANKKRGASSNDADMEPQTSGRGNSKLGGGGRGRGRGRSAGQSGGRGGHAGRVQQSYMSYDTFQKQYATTQSIPQYMNPANPGAYYNPFQMFTMPYQDPRVQQQSVYGTYPPLMGMHTMAMSANPVGYQPPPPITSPPTQQYFSPATYNTGNTANFMNPPLPPGRK